jgi:protein required for attachment to host cells
MRTCIAVIDATRARLFTFDRDSEPQGIRERLTEVSDLVDPARRQTPSELFSDSRPGSSRVGPRQYGFDDHRDGHIDHLDLDFCRSIVDELRRVLDRAPCQRLVLCAGPRMLGMLRPLTGSLRRRDLEISEVGRDLAKLTTPQLREHLAASGTLPPVVPVPRHL